MYLGEKFILLFHQRMIVLGRSPTGFWTFVAALSKLGGITNRGVVGSRGHFD